MRQSNSPLRFTLTFVSAIFVCVTVLQIAVDQAIAQYNWTSFRNGGSGITRVDHAPLKWSPDTGIAWRANIPGYGQSAPVVWKDAVFLTSSDGPFQETGMVHAIDLNSGSLRWTQKVSGTSQVENYFRNSRAAPTCTVDAQHVYSFFPTGDLSAMDHQGKLVWSVGLFRKFGIPDNPRGIASSLAQTNELLFVVVDHHGPSYLIAIDKSDGQNAWKADRGKRVPSWSSPVVARQDKNDLVVVSSADTINAYDAKSGARLWEIEGLQGNHIPSASVVDGSIYSGSTQMFGSSADPEKIAGSNCRVDLTMDRGKPAYRHRWSAERVNSYYSTPLAFAGHVYYVNKSGVLFCVDQETGKRVYAQRLGNPCWASAVGVTTNQGEKYVYFVLKNGFTVILRAGKKYDRVARNQLWDVTEMQEASRAAAKQRKKNTVPPEQAKAKTGPEKMLSNMPEKSLHMMFSYGDPIVYGAAIVNNRLLIRTGQHLYCVDGR